MKLELTNLKTWRSAEFEFGDSTCTLISGPSGQGKCFAPGTMIRMMNGDTKRVENIKTGDLVLGWNSFPREVISTTSGEEQMFAVKGYTNSGRCVMNYTVNASHTLTLLSGDDNVYDVTIYEYILVTQSGYSFRGFRAEIEYPYKHVELSPYLYGVLVHGDVRDIPLRTKRAMNVDLLREYGWYYNRSGTLKARFARRLFPGLQPITCYYAAIQGVANTSRVSDMYLYNTAEIRKQVLAGLVDRYGSVSEKHGEIILHSITNLHSFEGAAAARPAMPGASVVKSVTDLVNSLGGYAYIVDSRLFIGLTQRIPTRLVHGYRVFSRGLKITVMPTTFGKYYGFMLTGDGRFCLSDYTVTHNSSILQGVEFALFGTGKNLITHGEKSCSAKLTVGDTVITRTKRPNRLVLQTPQGELEDDSAQAWISHRFSARASIAPFITLTPSEKLVFLEETAFRDINISRLKELAKAHKRATELDLTKSQQRLQTTEEFLEVAEIPGEPPEGYSELQIKDLQKTEKRLKNARGMVTKINRSLEHYRKLLHDSAEANKEISVLQSQTETLQEFLENQPEPNVGELRVELAAAKTELNAAEAYLEYQRKVSITEQLALEIQETTEKSEETTLQLQEIIKNGEECKTEYDEIRKELDKLDEYSQLVNIQEALETEIEGREAITTELAEIPNRKSIVLAARTISVTCPCCYATLGYQNGSLIKCDSPSETEDTIQSLEHLESQLHQKLARIKISETKLQENMVKIIEYEDSIIGENTEAEYINKIEILETKISNGASAKNELSFHQRSARKNLEKLQKKLEKLEKELANVSQNLAQPTREIEEIETAIEMVEKELEVAVEAAAIRKSKEQELSRIQSRLARIEVPQDTEVYQEKIQELSERLPVENEKIDEYSAALEILREYVNYTRILDEYTARETAVRAAQRALLDDEKSNSNAISFQKKIIDAESTTLGSIITTLNTYAADYLNAFFPENPIIVEILPYKETAKRGGTERKSQITTRIEYRGAETDLSSLSSGEKDRVILAFSLAVNQIQNGKIIMLDECTSSLDAETSNIVFSKIRQNLESRCVLIVAHQIVQGIFDDVVEL